MKPQNQDAPDSGDSVEEVSRQNISIFPWTPSVQTYLKTHKSDKWEVKANQPDMVYVYNIQVSDLEFKFTILGKVLDAESDVNVFVNGKKTQTTTVKVLEQNPKNPKLVMFPDNDVVGHNGWPDYLVGFRFELHTSDGIKIDNGVFPFTYEIDRPDVIDISLPQGKDKPMFDATWLGKLLPSGQYTAVFKIHMAGQTRSLSFGNFVQHFPY